MSWDRQLLRFVRILNRLFFLSLFFWLVWAFAGLLEKSL